MFCLIVLWLRDDRELSAGGLLLWDRRMLSLNVSTTLIDRWLDSPAELAHHLDAYRRIAAGGQLWSSGRRTRPGFEPKASDCGEPTGTAGDGHETPMAGPMLS